MKDEVNKDIRPNQGRLRSLPIRGQEREKKLPRVERKKKEHNTAENSRKSNICFSICEMSDFSGGCALSELRRVEAAGDSGGFSMKTRRRWKGVGGWGGSWKIYTDREVASLRDESAGRRGSLHQFLM